MIRACSVNVDDTIAAGKPTETLRSLRRNWAQSAEKELIATMIEPPHRAVLAALMWASSMTRPDVKTAVRTVKKISQKAGNGPLKSGDQDDNT